MSGAGRRFSQGIGRWLGTAEVFDGAGRFVGNATDRRHVQKLADSGQIRIDLSFIGPMKFAGHYFIEDHGDFRLYQGPANCGYAETLASNLIDANAYWPVTGLTQRFFLMVLPDGQRQMSLALMSRGEKLIYVVVGEYQRVDEANSDLPALVNGTAYDLAQDPAAGRADIMLHRSGQWRGRLSTLDATLAPLPASTYIETVQATADRIEVGVSGTPFVPDPAQMVLRSNDWEAWSTPGDLVGSYSLSGGRALSGQFHFLNARRRLWRREVVSHDGTCKAVLHFWYEGGRRIGAQFGVLNFEAAA